MTPDEIEKDRAAGTPGQWTVEDQNVVTDDDVSAEIAIVSIDNVEEPQALADARRIARVPELEQAYLDLTAEVQRLTAERAAALALTAAAYEAAARMAKSAWLTTDNGTIGDAEYGEALCFELSEAIRALTSADAIAAQAARDERMRAEGAQAAEARIAKLVEALKFYADPDLDGYDVSVTDYGLSTEDGPIIKDAGEKARAAIQENSDEQ